MESSKIDDELKVDDKKEKIYDINLKNLNKEITSTTNKHVVPSNTDRNK